MADADSSTSTQPRYASDPPPEQAEKAIRRIQLPPIKQDLPLQRRPAEAKRVAVEVFAQTGSWVQFYREMLGDGGVCQRLFPTPEAMRKFEATPEFLEIQEMITALRSADTGKGDAAEPERMITIRLPKSLHDSLRAESEELRLSINKLCISKLLQRIDTRFVPVQKGRRRGRRPGPQGPRKSRQADQQSQHS